MMQKLPENILHKKQHSTFNIRYSNSFQLGFTMIEMIIVMSIIGILATFFTANVTNNLKKARNVNRKSDIRQYTISLENYASKSNGFYPSYTTSVNAADTLCTKLGLSSCPNDGKCKDFTCTGWLSYKYISDGTGGGSNNAKDYVLWSKQEETSTTYWIMCSNGLSGEKTSAPTSYSCPIGGGGGGCSCSCSGGLVISNSCDTCGVASSPTCTGQTTCACYAI